MEDIKKLMENEKADLVFTDPPYGMKKESDGVTNDNLGYDELLEFSDLLPLPTPQIFAIKFSVWR